MGFQGAVTKAEGRLGKIIAFRLAPGCDVKKSLEQVAGEAGIKAGVILSAVASLRKASFRNPNGFYKTPPLTDELRTFTAKEEAMEMLALSGNIGEKDGKPFVHAHITISMGKEDGKVYGGHLEEGCIIYTTGEIMIAELEGLAMPRVFNDETKVMELCPTPK